MLLNAAPFEEVANPPIDLVELKPDTANLEGFGAAGGGVDEVVEEEAPGAGGLGADRREKAFWIAGGAFARDKREEVVFGLAKAALETCCTVMPCCSK